MLRPSILVTGAGGFIGAMLVNALIIKGHEVVAVDRDQHRLDRISRGLCTNFLRLVCSDITDPTDILEVARQTQSAAIVHLAAMHVIPHCEAQPHMAVNVNIGGLCNMLAAADQAPVDFILFASRAIPAVRRNPRTCSTGLRPVSVPCADGATAGARPVKATPFKTNRHPDRHRP